VSIYSSIDSKLKLVARNTVEIVTMDELESLFSSGKVIRGYIGFECSGFMHIGIGLIQGWKIIDAREGSRVDRV